MTVLDVSQRTDTIVHDETFPDWFCAWRKQHREAFNQYGLPTNKHEGWKNTDVNFLSSFIQTEKFFSDSTDVKQIKNIIHQHRVQTSDSILLLFINGVFIPAYSDLYKLPEQVIACSLQDAITDYPDLVKQYLLSVDAKIHPVAALNIAQCDNGFFLHVPDDCEITVPLHFVFIPMNTTKQAHQHHILYFGKKSRTTIFQEFSYQKTESYMTHVMSSLTLADAATVKFYKLQAEGKCATHVTHTFIQQYAESAVTYSQFAFGSAFARDELNVNLLAPNSACRATGFYSLQQDNQCIAHHIQMNHKAERTQSDMFYKGIIAKKSRAVFNGGVFVEKNAQKIAAEQTNHHLLLSAQAEAYAKPELQIYADDVKCKHGATTGELDQDALFYLRSRGIPFEEAKQILLQSFANDILERVEHAGIKKYITGIIHHETTTLSY